MEKKRARNEGKGRDERTKKKRVHTPVSRQPWSNGVKLRLEKRKDECIVLKDKNEISFFIVEFRRR